MRAIAALMVVFHHARHYVVTDVSRWTNAGAYAVHFFFIISGFIMAYTTHRGTDVDSVSLAKDFMLKRVFRIAPLYWMALLIVSQTRFFHWDVNFNLVKDFLFIPHYSGQYADQIWPILIPGWAVNYEVFFYLIFGLAILAGKRRLLIASLVLVGLALAGKIFVFHNPIFRFYTSSVMFEFFMGVALFVLYSRTKNPPLPQGALLVIMAMAFLLMIPDTSIDGAISKGIPALFIVWSFLYAFQKTHNSVLLALGDASYAVYLFHVFALLATLRLFQFIGFNAHDRISIGFGLAAHLVISAGVGILVYRVIEKPLSDRIRKLLDPSRRLRSSANLLESARALNGTGKVSDGDIHKDLTKA